MTAGPAPAKGENVSFVFYDLETTGLLPEFDQALQFAAVRTDDDFNEVDSFRLRCRLSPHIVPSPEALLVNRVTPAMLTDSRLPSYYEALRAVRAKLVEWSPAVFIGYNSISFDEDFLRQGFFQTLQPIYLTNTTGNARGDMLKVVHATAIYAPSVLKIPTNEDGEPIYKLDRLAPANGYTSAGQHEAMADVRATLFLARLVRKKVVAIWETMARWTRKESVIEFLTQEEAVWHSAVFGHNKAYSWQVTYCGQNSERDSQLAAFDLQFDPRELLRFSVEKLIMVLNDSPKRIRTLAANRQPILMPYNTTPCGAVPTKVSAHEVERRIASIRSNTGFQQRVSKALAGRYGEEEPPQFVEQRIYGGFATRDDEEMMQTFHSSGWDDRVELLRDLEDERARELGQRLVYLEQPEALPKSLRARLDAWLAERILNTDPEVPWMTVPKALAEVDRLIAGTRESEDREFLKDLKMFLSDLSRRRLAKSLK
jgi:exodeoxyribonuclease-1